MTEFLFFKIFPEIKTQNKRMRRRNKSTSTDADADADAIATADAKSDSTETTARSVLLRYVLLDVTIIGGD